MSQLQLLREREGLSQREIAEKIKVDPSTYSRWERGHTIPRSWYLRKLATFYKLPNDTLLHILKQTKAKKATTASAEKD